MCVCASLGKETGDFDVLNTGKGRNRLDAQRVCVNPCVCARVCARRCGEGEGGLAYEEEEEEEEVGEE